MSRAALAGLRELGFSDVMVAVRSPDKARALADDFGCRLIPWDERERVALDMESVLLINATPLGMRGRDQDSSPLPESFWTRLADRGGKACSTVAYDLVYTPVETLFLRQAKSKGFRTIDGLSFFMAQAREQFRLWTGLDMPDDVAAKARELVLSRL